MCRATKQHTLYLKGYKQTFCTETSFASHHRLDELETQPHNQQPEREAEHTRPFSLRDKGCMGQYLHSSYAFMQIRTGGNGKDNQNKNHIGLLYRQINSLHIHHTVNYLNKDTLHAKRPPIPVHTMSKGVGLWPFSCWDCGFEPHRGHGCASLMSVVCSQVEEVSASG